MTRPNLRLARAVEADDPEGVVEAMAAGADPLARVRQHHGKRWPWPWSGVYSRLRPAKVAVFLGKYEALKAMLDHGLSACAVRDHESLLALGCRDRCNAAPDAAVDLSPSVLACVELLLQYGASPNATDLEAFSPLESAASSGDMAVVELLLAAGADPNQAILGKLPIATALWQGHLSVARLLIRAGARTDLMDRRQVTMAELAARLGAVVGEMPDVERG